MRRRLAIIAAVVALAIGGAAYGGTDNFRDVKNVQSRNPDSIENYNNMDGHPNIGKVCIDGVAFATTTRQYNAITRVPEWDKTCPIPK